jgi:hypothetical protein
VKPAPKAKVGEPVGPRKDKRPCERCAVGPMESDGVGLLAWCACGFTVYSLSGGSSHSTREDANRSPEGCPPAKAGHPSGSYAPPGKTQTSPLDAFPKGVTYDASRCAHVGSFMGSASVRVAAVAGDPDVGPVVVQPSPLRCARHGCGHLVTMHNEGGCALAECSCHEAVAPAGLARLSGVHRHDDDYQPAPLPSAMVVHALELENLTGLGSLKLSAFARTVGERTTLVLRVGVLS